MHVLLVLGVVSLFLSTSEGLEAKKGHHRHRLKELGKQKNLRGSLKEEKLLANGKYKVIGRNLKANQTTREATERSFALLSRTYSLKIKKRRQVYTISVQTTISQARFLRKFFRKVLSLSRKLETAARRKHPLLKFRLVHREIRLK